MTDIIIAVSDKLQHVSEAHAILGDWKVILVKRQLRIRIGLNEWLEKRLDLEQIGFRELWPTNRTGNLVAPGMEKKR